MCATPHQRRLFDAFIRAPAGNGVAPGHLCGRLSGLPRGRNSRGRRLRVRVRAPAARQAEPRARGVCVLPFIINTQILIRPSCGNQTLGERERRRGGGSPDSRVLSVRQCPGLRHRWVKMFGGCCNFCQPTAAAAPPPPPPTPPVRVEATLVATALTADTELILTPRSSPRPRRQLTSFGISLPRTTRLQR